MKVIKSFIMTISVKNTWPGSNDFNIKVIKPLLRPPILPYANIGSRSKNSRDYDVNLEYDNTNFED